MIKIILVTNMENAAVSFRTAAQKVGEQLDGVAFDIAQITDAEPWSAAWEKRCQGSAFVFFRWMGTGLSCDFLQQASSYLQAKTMTHLFSVMDGGDDILSYGIQPEEKKQLEAYLAQGGLNNLINAFLYLCHVFGSAPCSYAPPQKMPFFGIFHPDAEHCFTDTAAYFHTMHYVPKQKAVIALTCSREDWLWGHLEYQTRILRQIEQQNMIPLLLFTTMRRDEEQGMPNLADAMRQMFYKDGQVVIDALINTSVFSLKTTGAAAVQDLMDLGVVVLQAYNLYRDYAWWKQSYVGMTGNEVSYAIAMPEFDGIIHAVPVSTQEEAADGSHYRQAMESRIVRLVQKAGKWASLRHKANAEKKVAIIFHNYPPTNSNIGSAANLDSIESVRRLLACMQQAGYTIDRLPEDSQSFIDEITAHATNDRRFMPDCLVKQADGKMQPEQYAPFFAKLPGRIRTQLNKDWGEPPGEVFNYDGELLIPGMLNGNVYITVQPPRGFGEDPAKIYHSPDCAPTHHYLAFYHWIQDVWQADAMIHVGTHGNLEWLPGKGVAMSDGCYPDICTGTMPNIYPYWITCVGEGIQAKRRSAACLISYLSAPMSTAGSYEELADLEKLLEEYIQFMQDEAAGPALESMKEMIRAKAKECNLDEDVPEVDDFSVYVGNLHVFITDLKNMQIRTGMHIFGNPPEQEELISFVVMLTRLENGTVPSLTKVLARSYGYDYYELLERSGELLPKLGKTAGMLVDAIMAECEETARQLMTVAFCPAETDCVFALPWTKRLQGEIRDDFLRTVTYICTDIVPHLAQTTLEIENTMLALQGHYVEPSPSGAPTSGGADLLPTGRNFYSVDPKTLPTEAAWKIGQTMGDDVIQRFIREEGHYPESVGIILWATTNLRNHGQCVAEFLYLLGMRPVWQPGSRRVIGLELMSLEELRRPRVDVTGRISGLFRDSMMASIDWLNEAVRVVSELDEPLEMNYVRKHVLEDAAAIEKEGVAKEDAWQQASYRIFGDPPGAHGAGIGSLLEAKNWETIDDISDVYIRWGAHAYGAGSEGTYLPQLFKRRLSTMEVTIQNVDHRESSMLAGDDYNNYRGGLVAAVRSVRGAMPRNYVSDSSDRSKIQMRSLDEELKRWFRGEAMNPKYIEGMKKHGYKGAGDLATYLAVSYQWDATSDVMEDWMYDKYAQKYALDPAMQQWMREVNPWALYRMVEVLLEAEQRGMWNAPADMKEQLQQLYLSMEGELEERNEKS